MALDTMNRDERALAYARFNAALAGVALDLRAGSMLEPVRGETFDLVVSNPPFVITPRGGATADSGDGGRTGVGEFTYRDGGSGRRGGNRGSGARGRRHGGGRGSRGGRGRG